MQTLPVLRMLLHKDEDVLGISFAVFDCELCALDSQFPSQQQSTHSLTVKCFFAVTHSLTPIPRVDFSLIHRAGFRLVKQSPLVISIECGDEKR